MTNLTATTPWVEGKTIGAALRATAERHPKNDAVVFTARGWRASYEAFDAQVDALARSLLSLGLKKGDHVAIWAGNCPEWVLLQFATARIGVVLVTVNPAYRSRELEYCIRQSDAKMLVMASNYKGNDYVEILSELCPELSMAKSYTGETPVPQKPVPQRISEQFPELRWVVGLWDDADGGLLAWPKLLERSGQVSVSDLRNAERALSPDDAINIQYTSGTTGYPKGAMLTHRNLLLNAYYTGAAQRLTDADRMCIPVPLYHCFGCVLGTLVAAVHGAAMVFAHEFFDARRTLDAIERERCTVLYGVPTMFIAQLEEPTFAGRDLKSLRTGIMSGAPCPLPLMKRVVEEMHCSEVTIVYGQTEASPLITQTRCDDPIELRCGTVGRPLPGIEVRIVDPVGGEALPPGQPGELCARGHDVMLGYYNMPEQTARAIDAEGWLHTGDLAVELPNGCYRITGRLKDMIIRGGENIYPREVEEFLYTHPKIEEVQVVGVPDAKYGEQILAWIKLRAGQTATDDEIRDYCRQSLARFKVPHYIKFVDSFPMTVTGKIQKFKMREQAIRELGLEEASRVETA